MKTKEFNKIYFALLIAHLGILYAQPDHFLVAITKPTLLISLIGFYLSKGWSTFYYPQKLFTFGLVFSLVGDVLLINDDYFIFGLVSFLIAQICYAFSFYRSLFNAKGLIQKKPILATPVLIYAIIMVYILRPYVGNLLPAIVVYTAVISLMFLAAMNRSGIAQKLSAQWVIIGAGLFVLSDSLLAFNKFHTEFTGANVAVMLTYSLAQYFLVRGFENILPQGNKKENR